MSLYTNDKALPAVLKIRMEKGWAHLNKSQDNLCMKLVVEQSNHMEDLERSFSNEEIAYSENYFVYRQDTKDVYCKSAETILEMMEKAQERYERQETLNNKPEQPKPSIPKKPTRKGPKL